VGLKSFQTKVTQQLDGETKVFNIQSFFGLVLLDKACTAVDSTVPEKE
jgi:hypothetical protein